eukprot:Pgem_evm1s7860
MGEPNRRVKVYYVNNEGDWVSSGCGYVTCFSTNSEIKDLNLLVRNEEDGTNLLESKIQMEDVYKLQQGTLIVWTEED